MGSRTTAVRGRDALHRQTWTEEADAALIASNLAGAFVEELARDTGRSMHAIINRLHRLGYGHRTRPSNLPVNNARSIEIPEFVLTNEPAHITACLEAGGFGRIPLPWRAPLFVWRAA